MQNNLFQGELVGLKAVDPQSMAEAYSRWSQDTEYWRLMSGEPAKPMSTKATMEWLEDELYREPPGFVMFAIHTLDGDRLIGEIGFEDVGQPHGEAFVVVGLGERKDWGKGYGTDALHIILRYAFYELNLNRISLTVSDYNPRAIQSYIKAGFEEEGRVRGGERRDGRRFDLVYMGILREEWEKNHNSGND